MNRRHSNFVSTLLLLLFLTHFAVSSSNVDIKYIAGKLSEHFSSIKNDELGVTFIGKLYNSFKHVANNVNLSTHARTMALKLETKIADCFSALENAQAIFDEATNSNSSTKIPSTFIPCIQPTNDKDSQAYDLFFNRLFTDNSTIISDDLQTGYVLQKMRRNMGSIKSAVKQQYFISSGDVKSMQVSPFSGCSGQDNTIIWSNYINRNKYVRKNIILVLDHGGSLSKRQFVIVKSIAKQLISSLDANDRVALISIAADWFAPANFSDCLLPSQIPQAVNVLPNLKLAESSHKSTLHSFIDTLTRGTGATNHTLAMQKALEMIELEKSTLEGDSAMILYISRGLLSSLTEANAVLETIAQFTNSITVPIVINTCAVIDDTKPVMYETHFLRDIAEQNYTKFNITFQPNLYRKIGFMLSVNSTESCGFAVGRFYDFFNSKSSFDTQQMISLPTWDDISSDFTMSFTIGWLTRANRDFAVLGADVYFSNLVEDVTYYSSNQQQSYAFLVDVNGNILVHPSFPRASIVNDNLNFVDISMLEEEMKTNQALRTNLLTQESGVYSANGTKYVWNRVLDWFVVCIKVNTNYATNNKTYKAIWYPNNKLVYQNLLDGQDYKLCKHMNQVSTLDAATLYLSLSCFQSPFSASRASHGTMQSYLAYLKDDTRLLANPGLKDEVRDEVATLARVMDLLRKRHMSSIISKYTVRRYAASRNGVLQVYPGVIVNNEKLEPTKRPWFLQSLRHRNKLVVIPPYLDGGGAGYIVTLAVSTPQLVVAIDFSYRYIFKIMLQHMPFCLDEKVTCFLMDDQGYLIYHPNLLTDVNGARPIEQQHIVHKESLVANDILNHKHFIRKLLCNNYGDSTIQRYYRLNTSFNDVLSNAVPGDHCLAYRIALVPNTNFFLGIVNATCDFVATFCPCSVVDRLCLNCNRMEQKECECPCECPLQVDAEVCKMNRSASDNPTCTFYAESASLEPSFSLVDVTNKPLDSCLPTNCQTEQTYFDCLGLTSCEWCKHDVDGNVLRKPFCASQLTCFNGVLGAASPYKNDDLMESVIPYDSDYSPIGPILGSVIAMSVLLILLFICYRSYTSPSADRLYMSSAQDNQLRMSDLNVNNDNFDLGASHRDKLLQEDKPDPISPYCVASTYRRTAPPADSDHGYSTMTPHDESEHLSLAPIEVDSLEDDLTSDNTSISVSMKHHNDHVSSPAMFTRLPATRNCIVVPVTVHRNMETT